MSPKTSIVNIPPTTFQENVTLDLELGQEFRSAVDFIGKSVRLGEINTWAFEAVVPVNFMLKWHFGKPRPEELAYKTYLGEFDVVDESEDQEDSSKFPKELDEKLWVWNRPTLMISLPTMRGRHFIPPSLPCILRLYYAVAMRSTITGIHYVRNNIAGLSIGQRIIREKKLPGFLEEIYGYKYGKVKKRLKALFFDWNTFNSTAGTINRDPVSAFLKSAMDSTVA